MNLNKTILEPFIFNALAEDIGDGDHTSLSTIPVDQTGSAKLLIKENGIIAGVEVAMEIFKAVDPDLKSDVFIHDGEIVKSGDIAFYTKSRASGFEYNAADEWDC